MYDIRPLWLRGPARRDVHNKEAQPWPSPSTPEGVRGASELQDEAVAEVEEYVYQKRYTAHNCNTRRTQTAYIGEQRWNTKASESSHEAARTPSLRAGVARRRRKKKKAEAREGERPGRRLKWGRECAMTLRDDTARLRVRSALPRRVVFLATSTTREGAKENNRCRNRRYLWRRNVGKKACRESDAGGNEREQIDNNIPINGPTSK